MGSANVYICLCHGVTDAAIREAIAEGANSLRQLSFKTGCGTQCGSCIGEAAAILNSCIEARSAASAPTLLHAATAA